MIGNNQMSQIMIKTRLRHRSIQELRLISDEKNHTLISVIGGGY